MPGSNVTDIGEMVASAYQVATTFLEAQKAAHPEQTANNQAIDEALADLGFFVMVGLRVMSHTNPSKLTRIARDCAIQAYLPKGKHEASPQEPVHQPR
jgi:hypothetical protein